MGDPLSPLRLPKNAIYLWDHQPFHGCPLPAKECAISFRGGG